MSKALVYADQNVLGMHLERQINLGVASGVQWAYSKEHFAEIRRSEDPAPYLAVLDEIDAKLLDLELDNWKITGSARLVEGRAAQHFSAYCAAVGEVAFDDTLFDPFQAWVNGGGDEDMLRALPHQVVEQILALTDYLPNAVEAEAGNDLVEDFGGAIAQMVAWGNDVETTRAAFGVGRGRGAVGSVSGNHQIRKIWDMVSLACTVLTSDQFFGFDPPDKQGYEAWPVYLGIVGCCAVLDVLGFQAGKKCRKIREVVAIGAAVGVAALGGKSGQRTGPDRPPHHN